MAFLLSLKGSPQCPFEEKKFIKTCLGQFLSAHSEMADFGPGQGRSDFATAGVAKLR
jgi:hypothetical protein